MASELLDNRYRLEERIAVGGMAEVWAAQDLELERRVALKLLLHTADPERFAREARAAAGLSHPSICQLYDYGESDGRPYIVLEYLEGGTLEDLLQTGAPLPDDESERIAREIASGLAHAHAHGLVHRDVKPGNVLFDSDGAVKITDFGIAQIADASTLTEAGTLLGTAAYISPEQARGERATAASDVYSFGVILYRMLTGGLPFESESALELAAMHESTEPPPITSRRSDPPPALAHLAMAALAKRPEERPADGSALVTALEGEPATDAPTAVLASPSASAEDVREELPAHPRRRARQLLLGLALLALAAAGAGAALFATSGSSDPLETQPTRSVRPGGSPPTSARSLTGTKTTRSDETHGTRSDSTAPLTPPAPVTSATTSRPTTSATTPTSEPVPTTEPVTTTAPITTAPEPTTTETTTTAPPSTTTAP
jgi:serine/threonine protein kinase